ncbi:MAG: CDP-glucose 4,6-dehydratase [Candidatus Omnitrophota bacterium]
MNNVFGGVYRGKRVLVTGHTGFKGAWLALWLVKLGAEVAGFSKYLPSDPCLFEVLELKKKIRHYQGDITSCAQLKKVFDTFKPQVVFHLAAQPIVREAYEDPKKTFDTNAGGTVNVLECVRHAAGVEAVVMITSDKCYENVNVSRGYAEEDRLGGEDPYSASKGCAEIICSAYYRSFFVHQDKMRMATARAGNVIGGGDWAKDRIVPDCVRALSQKKKAVIRSPQATRPWQHVLEPLSGYLWLGASLLSGKKKIAGESFNFGPRQRASKTVGQLADLLVSLWGGAAWEYVPGAGRKKEALLLQLSPRKTEERLAWSSALSFPETIEFTALWYKRFYDRKEGMISFTGGQIDAYVAKARGQRKPWAGKGAL